LFSRTLRIEVIDRPRRAILGTTLAARVDELMQ